MLSIILAAKIDKKAERRHFFHIIYYLLGGNCKKLAYFLARNKRSCNFAFQRNEIIIKLI